MIPYETFCKIQDYHQHRGLTVAQIARESGRDAKTAGKWVKVKNYRPRASSPRRSKLDPFKPRVVRLLETHPYSRVETMQGHLGYPSNFKPKQAENEDEQTNPSGPGGTS